MSFITQPPNLTTVSGTLNATNGGTGLTSPGASGNVLTSDGTAWTSAAPGGSAFNLISTISASSNPAAFTGLSGYNNYLLVYDGISAALGIGFNVGTGSTPTYITSGNYYARASVLTGASTFNVVKSNNGVQFDVALTDSGSGWKTSGNIWLYNMTNGNPFHFNSEISESVYSGGYESNLVISSGYNANTTVKTAVKLYFQAGTGSVSLYGISS